MSYENEVDELREEMRDLQEENLRLARAVSDATATGVEAWKAHHEAIQLIADARRMAAAWKAAAEKAVEETRRHAVHVLRTEGHHVAAGVLHAKLGL